MILDLQENIYKEVEKMDYPSAGFAGRRIVDFKDLSIDISLEIQNQKYSQILYLIEYIAHGVQFCIQFYIFKENQASGVKQKCFRVPPSI